MKTQSAYETRRSLEHQRVGRRPSTKPKEYSELIKRMFMGASATLLGIPAVLAITNDQVEQYLLRRAQETLVTNYGDTNGDGIRTDEEDAGVCEMALRRYGIKEQDGVLYYNRKVASIQDIRNAYEIYQPTIVVKREE